MQRQDGYPHGYPRPITSVAVIRIAIACCALTMAIVIAVAMAASG